MAMRNITNLAGVLVAGVLFSTACTKVEPGEIGIQVETVGVGEGQPGYHLASGIVWYLPGFSRVFVYPTSPKTVQLNGPSAVPFHSKEGTSYVAELLVSFSLQAERIPAFYEKFRSDDLQDFAEGFLRTAITASLQEVGGRYADEAIYAGKTGDLLSQVQAQVNKAVRSAGVVVEQLAFADVPTPPEPVRTALSDRMLAVQQALRAEVEARSTKSKMEQQVAAAEGLAKAAIVKAKAEAEANRLLDNTLTPRVIEWEKLKRPGETCSPKQLGDEQSKKIPINLSAVY
jgi:regulator of protease activity HflC (stomatin/prohibitin superfamily)